MNLDEHTKTCSKCKKVKFLFEFRVRSRKSDGRTSQCKICMKKDQAYHKARYEAEKLRKKTQPPSDGTNWSATITEPNYFEHCYGR